MKKSWSLPTATEASMIAVMTIGSTASGNVSRLNRVNAGKTISVLSGLSWVATKTANVLQLTKNGVVLHVKLATAVTAPILRKVCSSWSLRITFNLLINAVVQAYSLIDFMLLR